MQTASGSKQGSREKGRDREAREKGHGHAAQQDDMRTERSSCPCAPRAPCAAPPDACPMPSDAWLLQRGALTHQVLICTSTTESSAQSDSRSAHVPCMPMSTSHADGPNGTTLRASSIRSSSRRGRSSSTHGRCSKRIAPCDCSLRRTASHSVQSSAVDDDACSTISARLAWLCSRPFALHCTHSIVATS